MDPKNSKFRKELKSHKVKTVTGSKFKKNLVGKRLGMGAEGAVYEYGKTRVIKFVSAHGLDNFGGSRGSFNKVMRYLKSHPRVIVSKVFGYGTFNLNGTESYFYISEKLEKLNYQESCDLNYALWEKKLKTLRYHFGDLHGGNVMKNKDGKQKVIDLTTFCWNE